jgi:hypothetical protein
MSEEDITLAFLLQASKEEIEQYRRYIGTCLLIVIPLRGFDATFPELPPALNAHPYWHASNRVEWVVLNKYALFLREASDDKRKDAFVSICSLLSDS